MLQGWDDAIPRMSLGQKVALKARIRSSLRVRGTGLCDCKLQLQRSWAPVFYRAVLWGRQDPAGSGRVRGREVEIRMSLLESS